jgi:hypothetical protein
MIKATAEEQQLYEEVYHFLRKIKEGETKQWRNTQIECKPPDGFFKMNDGERDYYHWHPHVAAIIVLNLCEKLQIGEVKEVGSK